MKDIKIPRDAMLLMTKKLLLLMIAIIAVTSMIIPSVVFTQNQAHADVLTNVIALPSNNIIESEANYVIGFTVATTGKIATVDMTFPTGFDISGAELIGVQELKPGSISSAGQVLTFTPDRVGRVTSGTAVIITIGGIINNDIQPGTQVLTVQTKDKDAIIIDGPNNSSPITLTTENWSVANDRFEFNDDIATSGVLQAGSLATPVNYNRIGGVSATQAAINNPNDLFVSESIETRFNVYTGGFIQATGSISTDSFVRANGGVLVGTNDPNNSDFVYFDSANEALLWDEGQNRFEFTDELALEGPIQTGGRAPLVDYNRMGFGATASHPFITNAHDLFVTSNIETDGTLIVDGRLLIGTDNPNDDDVIGFDSLSGVDATEFFWWDDSETQFKITDDTKIFGKLTVTGGVDPPYVSFTSETHQSIRNLAQDVDEHETVMTFWNANEHRMEVYVIAEDKFYTFDGKLANDSGKPEIQIQTSSLSRDDLEDMYPTPANEEQHELSLPEESLPEESLPEDPEG